MLGLVVVLGLVFVVVRAFGVVGFLRVRVLRFRFRFRSTCFFIRFYGYFLSSGWVFSSCSLISAASLSSVRRPSLVMVLPLPFVVWISPAVSSCFRIFRMLVPLPFLACSLMLPFLCLPP